MTGRRTFRRVSVPQKRSWWVIFDRSRALVAAIGFTVVAVICALFVPPVWLPKLLAVAIAALAGVAGWAAYIFYRRHPEPESTPTDDQDAK